MKRYSLLISTILCLTTFAVYGASEAPSDDIPVVEPKDPGPRPKAPSRKAIVCSVENGILSIEFRQPEGYAEIEILDLSTGIALSFEFDSAAGFRYALPPTSVSYQVTVRTEKNNIYIFENIK